MIRHIWSVLCGRSIVDTATQNISIIDCLERLTIDTQDKVEGSLSIPFNYTLVTFLVIQNKDKEKEVSIEVLLVDPEGRELGKPVSQVVNIPIGIDRLRVNNQISGILVNTSGTYWFKVMLKEGKGKFYLAAELPIEVIINVDK